MAEALARPAARPTARRPTYLAPERWDCLQAVKFARSIVISPGSPVVYDVQLCDFVFAEFRALLSGRGSYRSQVVALLSEDTRLKTLATVASGIPGIRSGGWAAEEEEEGAVALANGIVALLQRPLVRKRLQRELAKQQKQQGGRSLLSYGELLALFVEDARSLAEDIWERTGVDGCLSAEVLTAFRTAAYLLPQLTPDPEYVYRVALSGGAGGPTRPGWLEGDWDAFGPSVPDLVKALQVAEQRGSDYYLAKSGYTLGTFTLVMPDLDLAEQQRHPPSALFGWLEQAEAAHRRCKGVLPKQWTAQLDRLKISSRPHKAWLLLQGDTWREAPLSVSRHIVAVVDDVNSGHYSHARLCCGCGRQASALRRCGACQVVQYCR